jgi:hypothetical protein
VTEVVSFGVASDAAAALEYIVASVNVGRFGGGGGGGASDPPPPPPQAATTRAARMATWRRSVMARRL